MQRRSGKFDTPSSAGKGRRIQSAFKMLKKATTDHSRGYGYGLGSKKFGRSFVIFVWQTE